MFLSSSIYASPFPMDNLLIKMCGQIPSANQILNGFAEVAVNRSNNICFNPLF
ncbi:hypothetical protein BRYFOR_07243 [Marvinbryantia formatexigens DSM 14469]|uniref:Uncharacterized protein n=1 Tax=Marvinbryantia formatexigens DSM 14469 TaxID=478749 RepID=C6LF42_9FIRM|nr:hypothetical protein BRYFOR_07243 [Marvinbryantia formatexigens DSM 14469]